MVADSQMVRGPIDGGFNLAIGEPVVLQQRLRIPGFDAMGPYNYPVLGGEVALLNELKKLYPGKEIVIANGAKQALSAALHSIKCPGPGTNGAPYVYHPRPYWPSHKTLSGMADLGFTNHMASWEREENFIRISTSPNNPDGSENLEPCDIWDAVYAHWVYGWSGNAPLHKVQIVSASKLLGLSGVRVGWLITEDKEIADRAKMYVEKTTSGVSVLSQHYVAWALHWMEGNDLVVPALQSARRDMIENGVMFNRYLSSYCKKIAGTPDSERGMFAYFQIDDRAQDRFVQAIGKARVALVCGEICGAREPGWWRMNMAHDGNYTEDALRAIKVQM